VRDQVFHNIRDRKLLKPGDRVAVAVSGGADSVALLRVLLELREELGIALFVAHFNHQLRGEASDADEHFVNKLAHRHDLPFFSGSGDVRKHATANKLSLEHAARELRYRWLIELAKQHRFNAVATAHNADDQVETVLMKFLRGTGTRGFVGIHATLVMDDVPLIRPLLATPRAEIESYLNSLQQAWREDHTNLDTQHTRNRIRHELLPLLERDYNPNLRQLLAEAAAVARDEEHFWLANVGPELLRRRAQPRTLRLTGFDGFHVSLQRRLLKQFVEAEGIPAEFHLIESLRRCVLGETPAVNLPGGHVARREADQLQLTPLLVPPSGPTTSYEGCLLIPGICRLPQAGLTLEATLIPPEIATSEPPGTLLRALAVGPELTIRNWQPGDRFRPAHAGSEEKLKRLFSEKHIPADQRFLWPVALSGSQIVWVRGFLVAHDFAWVPGSGDALRIEALPADPSQPIQNPPPSV
jgi:tRNA(Ile)-lysidine synthase